MKVTTHGQQLVKVTRFGAVNAYFVREEDGLTLVDTLISGSAKGLIGAAGEIGAPIVRIALTHAHADHVGSVDALKEALPEAEVIISRRDSRFLTGDKSLDPGEPRSKPSGRYVKLKTTPDRLIEPGETVGSLQVVAAPGHTPGHVAFLDTRDRTLIAGDAYSTLGGVSTANRTNPRFPLVSLATWDKPTALQTARDLRALDPSRLAVGHGRVVESPAAEMDRAIEQAS